MTACTDDERREVARRLRAYGKEFGDPTWRELCNVVFWDEDSYPTAVRKLHLIDRLADLIEPPAKLYDSPDSSNSEADELEEDACWEVQSPGVDNRAWMLKDVCDRIREACGVSRDE